MPAQSTKVSVLTVVRIECRIGAVACVQRQDVTPATPGPSCHDGDDPCRECLHPRGAPDAEGPQCVVHQQQPIEVPQHGRKQQEHGVLPEQSLGQVVPAEVVVHLVEDLLLRPRWL